MVSFLIVTCWQTMFSFTTAQQHNEFGESMGLEGSELMEWVRRQQTHEEKQHEHLEWVKRLEIGRKEMKISYWNSRGYLR